MFSCSSKLHRVHTRTSVVPNPDRHFQQMPEPRAPATSIVHHAQELSKLSSKECNRVLPNNAQSMIEPKKKFNKMIFCERFVSYRSTPDHSHPSLTSYPTLQALQNMIANNHLLISHSLGIKTQNINNINRSLLNISVE